MAAYCGAIGSVNVLEFVSTELFDESQENPFLLQQLGTASGSSNAYGAPTSGSSSPHAKLRASPAPSPLRKHVSVRFAELPLDDPCEPARNAPSPSKMNATWSPPVGNPNAKRQSAVGVPTPTIYYTAPPPSNSHFAPYAPPPPPPPPTAYDMASAYAPPTHPVPVGRPSITITLPLGGGFQRQTSTDSNASTASILAEEAELHKLLYSLTQLGLGQQQQQQSNAVPMELSYQEPSMPPQQPQHFHDNYASAPTSPQGYNASSLWLPSASTSPEARGSASSQQTGTASLMFRPLPSRQSRRMTTRQSKAARRCSSAPNSPGRESSPDGFLHATADAAATTDTYGSYSGASQPSSPHHQRSRGSVTFLTVKNLLRGGGALARTVRREQPSRRPTCMGTELTISSRLKRREKFQRPTVITDAYHRVSDMKLGTSPMKVMVKHKAFPETHKIDGLDHEDDDHDHDADPGMPSPKGKLHRESLITLETLDKIGTRHACPVQLIEEPLPDFSDIQPRVDAWNHYKKPKKNLRRPSAWLLGATATMTPQDLHE